MKAILKLNDGSQREIGYSKELVNSIKWGMYDALLFNENPCPSEDEDDEWDNKLKEIRIIF